MEKNKLTTIQLSMKTVKKLKGLKIIKRESYEGVILRLIKIKEDNKL